MDEPRTDPFLDWFRRVIEARGVSLRQVAEYSGVSPSAVSAIWRGKGRPEMGTVYKLAKYFKTDPFYVLRLAGYDIGEEVDRPDLIPELDLAMWDIGRELSPEEQRRLARFIRAYLPEPPKPKP